jgi:hypothetical protein
MTENDLAPSFRKNFVYGLVFGAITTLVLLSAIKFFA